MEGELSLQASVMGELQRGCEGTARMAAADGGEQSVEVMPDTEGRMNALAAKLRHRPMEFSFLCVTTELGKLGRHLLRSFLFDSLHVCLP